MRNNERYLAFPPAVSQAFLEKTDLRTQSKSLYLYYRLYVPIYYEYLVAKGRE